MKKIIAIVAVTVVVLMVLLNGDLDHHEYIEANLTPRVMVVKDAVRASRR